MTQLITPEYLALNKELHERNLKYGGKGHDWFDRVVHYIADAKAVTYLDYGCGKGTLADAITAALVPAIAVNRYDPVTAPGVPEQADFVTCCDVLEHIEPALLQNVLADIKRVTGKQALLVISQRKANKTLKDGRNAHLIIKPTQWWVDELKKHFSKIDIVDPIKPTRLGVELAVLVKP